MLIVGLITERNDKLKHIGHSSGGVVLSFFPRVLFALRLIDLEVHQPGRCSAHKIVSTEQTADHTDRLSLRRNYLREAVVLLTYS